MYTINLDGDHIHVYNLESGTESLSYQQLATSIPIGVSMYGCIASAYSPGGTPEGTPNPTLFIVGGYDTSSSSSRADLQVLNLDDLSWLSNAPSMSYGRHSHGCIAVNDKLWAIGGGGVDSIEVINTTNIATGGTWTWQENGNLDCGLHLFGITVAADTIYIVGGLCSAFSDTVYTIDTVTNVVTRLAATADLLPTALCCISLVTVGDTIYGFGGYSAASGPLDSWITLKMLGIKYFLAVI